MRESIVIVQFFLNCLLFVYVIQMTNYLEKGVK